jgi:hypothetical protein
LINNLVSTSANQRKQRLDVGWCSLGGPCWLYMRGHFISSILRSDSYMTSIRLLYDFYVTRSWLLYDYCMNPAWRSPNQMCGKVWRRLKSTWPLPEFYMTNTRLISPWMYHICWE